MEKVFKSTKTQPTYKMSEAHPRSIGYYLLGKKYYKSIGKFATNAYFQTKEFLKKDIELPKPKLELPQPKALAANLFGLRHAHDHGSAVAYDDLDLVSKKSNEVLATCTTIFPFTLFRDTIILDRTKITLIQRNFFWSSKTMTFGIEDVLNTSVEVGPFFGSITIAIRVYSTEDHFTLHHFWRKDAIHLKHMIQGFVVALHNDIKYSHLDKEELCAFLEKLGHDQP